MLCLFVVFIAVEIAIVGPLPFISEILPQAKAIMLGAIVAGASLGRFVGAVLGAGLYERLGFGASAVAGTAITFGMAFLLWRFIDEGQAPQSSKSG
jgi:predicted MFS family arabinose efflux permease